MNPNDKIPSNPVVEWDEFWKPTLKERVKILLGWNLTTTSTCSIHRRSSSIKVKTKVALTKQVNPEQQSRASIVEAQEEQPC